MCDSNAWVQPTSKPIDFRALCNLLALVRKRTVEVSRPSRGFCGVRHDSQLIRLVYFLVHGDTVTRRPRSHELHTSPYTEYIYSAINTAQSPGFAVCLTNKKKLYPPLSVADDGRVVRSSTCQRSVGPCCYQVLVRARRSPLLSPGNNSCATLAPGSLTTLFRRGHHAVASFPQRASSNITNRGKELAATSSFMVLGATAAASLLPRHRPP